MYKLLKMGKHPFFKPKLPKKDVEKIMKESVLLLEEDLE